MLQASKSLTAQLLSVLTNLSGKEDSNPETAYSVDVTVGDGASRRVLQLELRPLLTTAQSLNDPHFIDADKTVLFFRNTLFICTPPPSTSEECENACLMAKKYVMSIGIENSKLRAQIAALEAIERQEMNKRREPIPDSVRHVVWVRDCGACVTCGATDDLQFDHIIPFSKGGSNAVENIQILCGHCNRAKSNNI